MFTHLLAPLDGSPLAEQALPVAEGIAARAGATLTLLHVVEQRADRLVHGQRHLVGPAEAEEYLQRTAARLAPGVTVRWHVHSFPTRDVAEGLGFHSHEMQADLVVMCAHGGVRLRDRLFGNLAQQLAKRQEAPILLLGPDGGPFPFRRLVVPLDGRAEHERGLRPAADLAVLGGSELLLMTVVSLASASGVGRDAAATYLPGTAQRIADARQHEAAEYLDRQARALADRNVRASAVVARGDPAREILAAARTWDADLVVLTTHGKAGTEAFWSGSVPPRLLRRFRRHFLLVPAGA